MNTSKANDLVTAASDVENTMLAASGHHIFELVGKDQRAPLPDCLKKYGQRLDLEIAKAGDDCNAWIGVHCGIARYGSSVWDWEREA